MSDLCLECQENLDDAIYSKFYNAWVCKCGYLNPNCDGARTVPHSFFVEGKEPENIFEVIQ